jgi:hypothetical protein
LSAEKELHLSEIVEDADDGACARERRALRARRRQRVFVSLAAGC